MNILLDTNIINRLQDPTNAMYPVARDAVQELLLRDHTLCLVPQNLYEFWVVSTRPKDVNGLGKSVAETVVELVNMQTMFTFLDDPPALFRTWETLVQAVGISGKNAHDARLVAAMQLHSITHLLTFNDKDFRRFTSITVLTPAAVIANPMIP